VGRGVLGEGVQVLGGQVVIVDGVRGQRRTHQHRVRAEPAHQLELAFRPAQVGPEHLRRDRLEVVERLVQADREAEIRATLPHLLR
jgi:hypothetical protein